MSCATAVCPCCSGTGRLQASLTTRVLPLEVGAAAIPRTPAGLKVCKARGRINFLTHIGPHGYGKPLWMRLDLAIAHYDRRPKTIARLLDADREHGVDAKTESTDGGKADPVT